MEIILETSMPILKVHLCEWLWKDPTEVIAKRNTLQAGWRKIGLLEAWNQDTQPAAIGRNASGTLFAPAAIGRNASGTLFAAENIVEVKEESYCEVDEEWLGDLDPALVFDTAGGKLIDLKSGLEATTKGVHTVVTSDLEAEKLGKLGASVLMIMSCVIQISQGADSTHIGNLNIRAADADTGKAKASDVPEVFAQSFPVAFGVDTTKWICAGTRCYPAWYSRISFRSGQDNLWVILLGLIAPQILLPGKLAAFLCVRPSMHSIGTKPLTLEGRMVMAPISVSVYISVSWRAASSARKYY
ncbi:hypothetical protein R1flu_001428 [Riccia fluitans]|uniref:Uncharacterized protein n=1 Tax=Riccia fluitans TaxID=41844 RepID=A0ABD1Y385_9MARC